MKRFTARTTESHLASQSATWDRTLLNQSANSEVLGKVPTVLVIESDPIVRNLLRGILFRKGFMVLDAVNRPEAMRLLEAMAHEDIDLLIADHDGVGGALIGEVENMRPGVKTLFTFAGEVSPELRGNAVAQGTAFMQKPFTETRLLEAVFGLLDPTTQ